MGKEKKPFDKKAWREKKYSNKVRVDEWQNKRKVYMQRKYHKMLKKEGFQKVPPKCVKSDNANVTPMGTRTPLEDEEKIAEKKRNHEEIQRKNKERDEAMKKYKERKTEKFKKISAKTKRGQPVMAGRMELLLERIQKQCTQ